MRNKAISDAPKDYAVSFSETFAGSPIDALRAVDEAEDILDATVEDSGETKGELGARGVLATFNRVDRLASDVCTVSKGGLRQAGGHPFFPEYVRDCLVHAT